jgi:hypothetical protein
MRIPKNLIEIFNYKEIRISLQTTNYKLAQSMIKYIAFKVDFLFSKIVRKKLKMVDDIDILELIQGYIEEARVEYSEIEDKRHNACDYADNFGVIFKGHTKKAIENKIKELSSVIQRYEPSELEQVANEILDRSNIDKNIIDELNKSRKKEFYSRLIKAEINILTYDNKRNLSLINEDEKSEINFLERIAKAMEQQPNSSNMIDFVNSIKTKKQERIKNKDNYFSVKSKLFYETEHIPRNWTDKTLVKTKQSLKIAVEIMGDKDLKEYTREDFEKFRATLINLPSNYEKLKDFKGLSPIEASNLNMKKIKQGKGYKTLANATINKTLAFLNTF